MSSHNGPDSTGRQDDRAARRTRAEMLIEVLEHRIADAASAKAQALATICSPALVCVHRHHHAYALGADQAGTGMSAGDARAMRGLMSIGPVALAERLEACAADDPAMHVTRMWPQILASDRPLFEARGRAVDARRAEAGADADDDQRSVFARAVAVGTVLGHRDEHAFVLGSDLFYCGLVAGDALALLGLMSAGPPHVAERLCAAGTGQPRTYAARLWRSILDQDRDDYEARGRFVRWQRAWVRYKVDHDAWIASGRASDPSWRTLRMTSGQRHLVRDTAVLLGREVPEDLDCGGAHDWLMANGANASFRKEK